MSITLPQMTAARLEKMPDDGFLYDLFRGELLQMSPASRKHGQIAGRFYTSLVMYLIDHPVGEIFAWETGFLIETDPDTVLAPDVSFVRRERLPQIEGVEGFVPIAPDFVLEVISPSDRYSKVDEKTQAWLDAGTQVVIILDPRRAEARVYRPLAEVRILSSSETLELPDIVPGWSVPLSSIFA